MNIHALGTLDPSIMPNLPGTVPIIDADPEDDALFEDRPWRRPGADLTDYFNFGFDEQSWREYCVKQRTLRDEQATKRRIGLVMDAATPSNALARGLHLGPGGNLPGMIPPLPPFLPPPPPWILQRGQPSRDRSRDREHRGEQHRESTRGEHRDRDRERDRGGEHREHYREPARDRDAHGREGRSSHRDSKGSTSSGRHSSRRSASPSGGHPSRTTSSSRR